MNRPTLYYRLSLIWLLILASGVVVFLWFGKSIGYYYVQLASLEIGSVIRNDAPP